MSLAGQGAILIWNDIAEGRVAEFYDWHTREHMPERVGIPGFLRGRRYDRAEGEAPQLLFTLYETSDTAVTTGAAYLERLNNPTPWTREMTSAFRNMQRGVCRIAGSLGSAAGGIMATVSFAGDPTPARIEELCTRALPAAVRLPDITGAHVCVADAAGSAIQTAEKKLRGGDLEPPGLAILIEGCGLARVKRAVDEVGRIVDLSALGTPVFGFYRLQTTRLAMDGAVV
jgi:hypothetical protein